MGFAKIPEAREVEFLQDFFSKSAFTLEGVDISTKELRKEVEKCFRAAGYDRKNFEAFYFTGSVMNKHYGLTGDNAYPDDLTFVVVPEFYSIPAKVALKGRWFDDIVCNNHIRQQALDTGLEPDYE